MAQNGWVRTRPRSGDESKAKRGPITTRQACDEFKNSLYKLGGVTNKSEFSKIWDGKLQPILVSVEGLKVDVKIFLRLKQTQELLDEMLTSCKDGHVKLAVRRCKDDFSAYEITWGLRRFNKKYQELYKFAQTEMVSLEKEVAGICVRVDAARFIAQNDLQRLEKAYHLMNVILPKLCQQSHVKFESWPSSMEYSNSCKRHTWEKETK